MGARACSLTVAFVISLGAAVAARAVDRPIEGQRLTLKRVGTTTKLTFVSRDPDFLFPAIGGPDDPATGTPGGATIELLSQAEGQASVAAPAGAGHPGWAVATGPPASYRFRNRQAPAGISPVRAVLLRQGRTLRAVVKDAGLPLAVPQVVLGIRITTGTLRSCARFSGSAIRKDQAGAFVGAHSSADFSECSDDTLRGLPSGCELSLGPACNGPCPGDGVCGPTLNGCACVFPSSPCGQTSPACNGTCPAGESCAAVGPGPFYHCVCLQEGSTPCGDPGAPVCGGACPSGTACKPVRNAPIFGGNLGCDCAPPGPCGQGGADCANGFACSPLFPSATCTPIGCDGSPTYPTCGGTCVSGATCQALKLDSAEFTTCVCAVPAPCDAACGGYTCASGEVCIVQQSNTCSCGAP